MSKFYFTYQGQTKSIDLKTNFGDYFNQTDKNCDYVGVTTGSIDTGYRAGNQTIYAGQIHPYPIATKLTSKHLQQTNYYYDVLLMSSYVKFNEPVILSDINNIVFRIETTYTGGGPSNNTSMSATFSADEFEFGDDNTEIKRHAESSVYQLINEYVDDNSGTIIDMFNESNIYYSSARGYSQISGTELYNYRSAKLKIIINFKDGTTLISNVVSNNYYNFYYLNNFYSEGYFDNKSDLTWDVGTSSTEYYSDWYPMLKL